MLLAILATSIVIVALLAEVAVPKLVDAVQRHRARRRRVPSVAGYDPGR
jgi:Tfp pilus assembly protein FimT